MSAPSLDIRVVVCDDHALFRRSLVMELDDADDIEVVAEASSGPEAVQIGAHMGPDVVLMDVRMPGIDGVSATRALLDVVPTTRVLMLTVADDEDDLLMAVRAGAAGSLSKETAVGHVAAAIRAVARGETLISRILAAQVLADVGAEPVADPFRARLSPREQRVLELLSEGADDRSIADAEGISVRTVHNHVRNVLAKLHLQSRTEAVLYAVREGLLEP